MNPRRNVEPIPPNGAYPIFLLSVENFVFMCVFERTCVHVCGENTMYTMYGCARNTRAKSKLEEIKKKESKNIDGFLGTDCHIALISFSLSLSLLRAELFLRFLSVFSLVRRRMEGYLSLQPQPSWTPF